MRGVVDDEGEKEYDMVVVERVLGECEWVGILDWALGFLASRDNLTITFEY